jgi:ankyrin repeat protein
MLSWLNNVDSFTLAHARSYEFAFSVISGIDNQEIAKKVLAAFSKNKITSFYTKMYATGSHQDKLNEINETWQKQKKWKTLHEISAEKIKSVDSEGAGWLYVAAKMGLLQEVKKLLQQTEADPNIKTDNGITPLYIASQNDNFSVVEYLLNHKDIDPNLARADGVTPLFIASQNGNFNVVEALLKHKNINPNLATFDDGATALYIAAQVNHFKIVQALLTHKYINPNLCKKNGSTPLYIAAYKNNLDIGNILLADKRVDPNLAKDNGATPLYIASERDNLDFVKALLAREDIKPNLFLDDGTTPLFIAAQKGHFEVVDALLAHKDINPNLARFEDDLTPLIMAAYLGHLKVVKLLLAHKDIDLTNIPSLLSILRKSNKHADIIEVLERAMNIRQLLDEETNEDSPRYKALQRFYHESVAANTENAKQIENNYMFIEDCLNNDMDVQSAYLEYANGENLNKIIQDLQETITKTTESKKTEGKKDSSFSSSSIFNKKKRFRDQKNQSETDLENDLHIKKKKN